MTMVEQLYEVGNKLPPLELAQKEMAHLAYTHRTLFAQKMDIQWVQSLEKREELSEKVECLCQPIWTVTRPHWRKADPPLCRIIGRSSKIVAGCAGLRREERLGDPC